MKHIGMDSVLHQFINNSQNKMFTALPCRVTSNEGIAEQRINVQPVVQKVKTDDSSESLPIIQSVPLIFPGSSSSQFTFPVNVGDVVLCVFSQRSIDRFKLGSSKPHRPIDFRKFSRNDACAIPGLFSFPDAPNSPNKRSLSHSTEDSVVTHNIGSGSECEVRMKPSGDVIINSPSKVEVNCQESVINSETSTVNAEQSSTVNTTNSTVNASSSATIESPTVTIDASSTTVTGEMLVQGSFTFTGGMSGSGGSGSVATFEGSMKTTGNIDSSSDVTASGISLTGHKHGGVESGGSKTSTPE